MSNTKQAKAGDIVRSKIANYDITEGNLYQVYKVDSRSDSNTGYCFCDDRGNPRAFWDTSEYEVLGKLNDLIVTQPALKDIQGDDVHVGDYVAYAYTGAGCSGSLAVYRIDAIKGVTADAVRVEDNVVFSIGLLDRRAVKLKDYKGN